MKSIALIHTVKKVAATFEEELRSVLKEDVKIHNMLDEFLASNPNEVGEFTIENKNRLFLDMKAAELTGADVIVTTCSTLTPTVEQIRPFIKTPIIAIDDAMAKQAITFGAKVMILATAGSTIEPTVAKISNEAKLAEKQMKLSTMVCDPAFRAMQKMDMKTHDQLVKEAALEIKNTDCIVLAQASMAHLEKEVQKICGCPVLSSPRLCMKQVKDFLNL